MSKIKKYPYTCQLQNLNSIKCNRPLVDVEISAFGRSFVTQGWIDSGCTMTHADADIAVVLGIDLSTLPEVQTGGIHGDGVGYMSEVEFALDGIGKKFDGPIIFVKDLFVPILLGQENFFDKFNICFKKSEKIFTVEWVE